MTVQTNPESLVKHLNKANPNTLADQHRLIGFGDLVRRFSVRLRRQAAPVNTANVVSDYDLAANGIIFLPDDAKAKTISRVYGRANGNSIALGELTVDAYGTTPATTHCAVTPAGNIAFLGTDAWTDVDVEYTPEDQDIVELTLPVVAATGICTIPVAIAGVLGAGQNATVAKNVSNNVAGAAGVNMLLEAESLVGGVTGKFIVLKPSASLPGATKEANLDGTKMQVLFKVSDAVTSCRVKLGVFKSTDLNALLEAASPLF
jgi:hypothetical protein